MSQVRDSCEALRGGWPLRGTHGVIDMILLPVLERKGFDREIGETHFGGRLGTRRGWLRR